MWFNYSIFPARRRCDSEVYVKPATDNPTLFEGQDKVQPLRPRPTRYHHQWCTLDKEESLACHSTVSWIVYLNKIKKDSLTKQPILLNGEIIWQASDSPLGISSVNCSRCQKITKNRPKIVHYLNQICIVCVVETLWPIRHFPDCPRWEWLLWRERPRPKPISLHPKVRNFASQSHPKVRMSRGRILRTGHPVCSITTTTETETTNRFIAKLRRPVNLRKESRRISIVRALKVRI